MAPDAMGPGDEQDKARIRANIAKMQAKGASDTEIESYLRDVEGLRPTQADPNAKLHADYKSGALQRRVKGANEVEQANVPSMLETASQVPETVAAGVPGAKLLISGARAKLQGRPMAEVQQEVNAETSDVPYASAFGRALGTMALLPILPTSGAASGAIIGGADQALANDQSGVLDRAGKTLVGAGTGAALGKAADMAFAAPRVLMANGGAAAKKAAEAVRGEIADPAYSTALAGGRGRPLTPEMQAVLSHPDIAPRLKQILSMEQHAGQSADTPEVLDAVYKELSDWSHGIEKAGAVTDPSKPNLTRSLKQHVRLLKDKFLDAADKQMPGYREAVEGYADASQPLRGMEMGYNAVRGKATGTLPAFKNLGNDMKSPDAAIDAALTPAQGRGMATGSLAAAKDLVKQKRPLSALWNVTAPLGAGDAAAGVQLPSAIEKALLALASQQVSP